MPHEQTDAAYPSPEEREAARASHQQCSAITAKVADECRENNDIYSAEFWDNSTHLFEKAAAVGAVAWEDPAVEAEMAYSAAEEFTGIQVDLPEEAWRFLRE